MKYRLLLGSLGCAFQKIRDQVVPLVQLAFSNDLKITADMRTNTLIYRVRLSDSKSLERYLTWLDRPEQDALQSFEQWSERMNEQAEEAKETEIAEQEETAAPDEIDSVNPIDPTTSPLEPVTSTEPIMDLKIKE